jgi:hypothetical protein
MLIAAGVLLLFIIVAWTGVKVLWWKREQHRAQEEYLHSRFTPDGAALPRATRGICAACGRPQAEVYHLSTGERLCRRHYLARSTATEEAQRRSKGPI